MNRRGFALLTALWLIVALGALTASLATRARAAQWVSGNRVRALRAAWARDACGEIAHARYRGGAPLAHDSIDLGSGVWCRVHIEDPTTRIPLNTASPVALRRLFGDSLADAVLDWRDADPTPRPAGAEAEWYRAANRREPRNGPFAAISELRYVRGLEGLDLAQAARLLTVRGSGRLNVNDAPLEVVALMPPFDERSVARLGQQRQLGMRLAGLQDLLGLFADLGDTLGFDAVNQLQREVAFGAEDLTIELVGAVGSDHPVARGWLTVRPVAGRLAVLRREVW